MRAGAQRKGRRSGHVGAQGVEEGCGEQVKQ
jgi:hypothetical protein